MKTNFNDLVEDLQKKHGQGYDKSAIDLALTIAYRSGRIDQAREDAKLAQNEADSELKFSEGYKEQGEERLMLLSLGGNDSASYLAEAFEENAKELDFKS